MSAVILKKVGRLREKLSLIEPLASVPQETFTTERSRRDLCAYYLILAIEECRDLTEHLIAENAWGVPESAAEAFELLARQGVIDAALARRMREAVGLRNLLVHEYAEVDWGLVHAAANDLSRLREFLAEVLRSCGLAVGEYKS